MRNHPHYRESSHLRLLLQPIYELELVVHGRTMHIPRSPSYLRHFANLRSEDSQQ